MVNNTEPINILNMAQENARRLLDDAETPEDALEQARQNCQQAADQRRRAVNIAQACTVTLTILESVSEYTNGERDDEQSPDGDMLAANEDSDPVDGVNYD